MAHTIHGAGAISSPRYPTDLRVVITAAVYDRMEKDSEFRFFVSKSLARHMRGDWGEIEDSDKVLNGATFEVLAGATSAYEHPTHPKLYVITDPGHSVVTVLFPDEY